MATSFAAAILQPPADTDGVAIGYTQQEGYLRCVGTGGAYTTDHASLDITGDLEIVVRLRCSDWTPAANSVIVAKRNTGADSYMFRLSTTGALVFGYFGNGGAVNQIVTSTNTLIFGSGTCLWLRVTFDADNGAAGTTTRFYWQYDSDDEPHTWQQLGIDVVTATAVTLNSTTALLEIGSRTNGTTDLMTGDYYRVIVRNIANPINTMTVFDADFTAHPGEAGFVEATGKTVTFNVNASALYHTHEWRIALQMLAAYGSSFANGSRWGTFKWGTGAWSDYQWYDLTSDLTGVQWSRGALPTGQGFPTASPGVMNFQLQDSGNTTYQPWSTVGGNLNREMKPGAIVRLVAFRPGAAGSVYYPGNGFSTMCRAGWKALYTGEVDEWKYTIVNGSALADVTCYETITQLAAIQKPAVAAEGANDDLITRIYRLTQDAGWAFHIVDTGQYRLQGDYFTNNYSTYYNERPDYILQATTMAAKRSAEIYLSAASILNTQVSNSGDGALQLGVPMAIQVSTSSASYPFQVVRFQNRNSSSSLASDATNFPHAITVQYAEPVVVAPNSDSVINSVSATRVGGAAQTAEGTESIGLYGTRSYKRTDLICTNDTLAGLYASGLLTYDGYSATYSPTVDQSLQVSALTFYDDFAARLAIDLHSPCITDVYGIASYPDIRMLGRITYMADSLTKTQEGMHWVTSVQTLSTTNYKPTS